MKAQAHNKHSVQGFVWIRECTRGEGRKQRCISSCDQIIEVREGKTISSTRLKYPFLGRVVSDVN